MRNPDLVTTKGLIASDDKEVSIEAKNCISIFEYLNYLVTCMSPSSQRTDELIKTARYTLVVHDDYSGELGGPYFTVRRINTSAKLYNQLDTYEIDIGYPSAEGVLNFSIDDDQTYSILYQYSKDIKQSDYIYRINDDGKVIQEYSPAISNNKSSLITTESDKTWWTQVTQYPIKATLTIKGLLKASTLMTYIKINTYFYGQKHLSSGMYVITKQQDIIDASGYKTILSLTRILGDE